MTNLSANTAVLETPSQARANRPEVFLMVNTFNTGGGERQFAALAGGLDRERLSVRLGCLRNHGVFGEGLKNVVEFSPGGSLLGVQSQRTRLALSRYLRSHGVALTNSFDFYSNLMLIPAARLAGVQVVVGSHRQLGDLMSWPRFWAQRCVFQLCDRVVCNSREGAAYLRKRGGIPDRKLAVIPNGLPDAAFETARSAFPKLPGVLRVGMVARMNHPAKNHAAFLRMASKVAKTHPQVEFVLVGDGPLRSSLEAEAASLGLGKKVVFLGERHDIPAILASLDVAVLTSKSESLSNAIMESMAAGLPVVVARVGGNPELVIDGGTGFLVPSGDDDAFTAALTRLLGSADMRAAFGARANREARDRFRLENICKQYQDLYLSVLEEKGWSPAREPKTAVEN